MKCTNCGLTAKNLNDDGGECPDCGDELSDQNPPTLLEK